MKPLAAATLGLMVGALATHPGCSCFGCPIVEPLPPGTYGATEGSAESDYRLIVSDDASHVTETFTRGSDAWVIEYEVLVDGADAGGGG